MALRSTLAITTAATDLSLLTLAELRAAIGVANNSKDAELASLGARVAARIAAACNIAAGGVSPPTLRLETVTETFRVVGWGGCSDALRLSRRPIVSVGSVSEDGGAALDAANYEIDGAALVRLNGSWGAASTAVVYDAGWAVVPSDLKLAAERLARNYWYDGTRDPATRSVEIPGVRTTSYWVGSPSDPDIPDEIMDMLQPYRIMWL